MDGPAGRNGYGEDVEQVYTCNEPRRWGESSHRVVLDDVQFVELGRPFDVGTLGPALCVGCWSRIFTGRWATR